ncbi:MAG: hypothetical protein V1740_03865 [Candidatus Woesearchaeota archaeon]
MNDIRKIYQFLLKEYGHQGWWPLLDVKENNPTKTGSLRGYHLDDYSYPKNEKQKFEICIGAILTQVLFQLLLIGLPGIPQKTKKFK